MISYNRATAPEVQPAPDPVLLASCPNIHPLGWPLFLQHYLPKIRPWTPGPCGCRCSLESSLVGRFRTREGLRYTRYATGACVGFPGLRGKRFWSRHTSETYGKITGRKVQEAMNFLNIRQAHKSIPDLDNFGSDLLNPPFFIFQSQGVISWLAGRLSQASGPIHRMLGGKVCPWVLSYRDTTPQGLENKPPVCRFRGHWTLVRNMG